MEYQRQQLLVEKQQFHQEQLKLAEIRARASHATVASPAGSESAQSQIPHMSSASESPQPVQPVLTQPARVPTPGNNYYCTDNHDITLLHFLHAMQVSNDG